jgi:hypothetical protein
MRSAGQRTRTGKTSSLENFRVNNRTGNWTSEAWEEELEALTQHVRFWFQEATSRFKPPTEVGCRKFANHLMIYFHPREKGRPPSSRQLLNKYGRVFLKHLGKQRETIEEGILFSIFLRAIEKESELKDELLHVRETERHIKYLLGIYSSERSGKTDPIRLLADLAQELWKETNDGNVPTSKGVEGELCRLLDPVMEAFNQALSRETISAILRKRRRNGTRYATGS